MSKQNNSVPVISNLGQANIDNALCKLLLTLTSVMLNEFYYFSSGAEYMVS